MISWEQIETRAVAFSKAWKNCAGDERQDAQNFEKDIMNVFGVDWHEGLTEYQVRDINGRLGYIDYLLPGRILIEMKSKGESLIRAYNQGYDYTKCLKPDEFPELLMVSDFNEIQVTNLRTMQTFNKFKVSNLKGHVRMFGIIAGYKSEVTFKTDVEVNTDASYKMAKIHDALKENGYIGDDLEVFLVRLLFCLFADDTGIFEKDSFENYIRNSKEDGSDLSGRIMTLFSILNTPKEKRMINLPDNLVKFRYIDGGLFEKTLPPAFFNSKMREVLLECCKFNWSYISPAIFGAMFQGVMNNEERRELGAHYTSEENIMKVIKPLFLDELWDEFQNSKNTKAKLEAFQDKISSLLFLDPACGCGNFLIITYRELRLLEFEVLKMLYDNQQAFMPHFFVKVSVIQFYGIEYEDFPCQIAKVGMLLMKHQMDQLVSNYFGMNYIDFPIRNNANIIQANALKIDWNDIVSKENLNYIVGNPPFVGARLMNPEQKVDMIHTFGENFIGVGNLDYVSAWYKKTAELIKDTNIMGAFVSTNSIVQGEQVPILWKPLFELYNIQFNFAYRTFTWRNDAKGKAAVHCVIIGFSKNNNYKRKLIFDNKETKEVKNINGYLVDAPNVFIKSRPNPICNVPNVVFGNMPNDNGNLILTDKEYEKLILKEPIVKQWVRPFIGAYELINKKTRWCLWLPNVNPKEILECKEVMKRIKAVQEYRKESKRTKTRELAETPTLFGEIRQPNSNYIAIPLHSSEKREYIPIGFIDKNVIASNALELIPNASLYLFGILISKVHMTWMRAVGGRIKSDYRYSKDIIYNNFPFPNPNVKQKEFIEKAAQDVLDARELYADRSLADLYNPLFMPVELLKAHHNLDKEVCKAYGVTWETEAKCITDLINMYVLLVKKDK